MKIIKYNEYNGTKCRLEVSNCGSFYHVFVQYVPIKGSLQNCIKILDKSCRIR